MTPFTPDALPPGHMLFPTPTYFDEAQFFGREADVERIRQFLDAGSSVALSGKRRIGRSWFLQHLRTALPQERYLVVFSDELKPDTIVPRTSRLFLYALIFALHDALRTTLAVEETCALLDLVNPPPNLGQAFRRDLEVLHRQLAAVDLVAVLLIDEAEALLEFTDEAGIVPAIVRGLAVDHPQLRIIVAGFDLRSPVGNQPSLFDAFAHHQLYDIGTRGAYNLIAGQLAQYGVTFASPEDWRQVSQLTGEEPSLLRLLGQQLTEQARYNQGTVGAAQVQAAVEDFFAMSQVDAMLRFAWHILGENQPIHALITALAYGNISDKASQDTLVVKVMQQFYPDHPPETVQHDLRWLATLGFLREDHATGCLHFSSDLLRQWICRHRPDPGV